MLRLNTAEANCLADINNPGFGGPLYETPEQQATIVSCLRLNVQDTFLNLYPGSFGEKWGIDEQRLLDKLAQASNDEVHQVADAITSSFWDECLQGKGMDAY